MSIYEPYYNLYIMYLFGNIDVNYYLMESGIAEILVGYFVVYKCRQGSRSLEETSVSHWFRDALDILLGHGMPYFEAFKYVLVDNES